MSNAAKDTSANDDVLASIRRLVAEESSRSTAVPAAPEAEPENAQAQSRPTQAPETPRGGRVLQRRRAPDSGTTVDRHSINRAARAKLLLTDDFRVEDMERWSGEDPDEIVLPAEPNESLELPSEPTSDPEPMPQVLSQLSDSQDAEDDDEDEDAPTHPEAAAERTVHGRGVYDDEDQVRISKDIESFLSAPVAQQVSEPVAPEQAEEDAIPFDPDREIGFEDIPDAVLSANRDDRAARRRAASERARTETSRASEARRGPAEQADAPEGVEDAPEAVEQPARVMPEPELGPVEPAAPEAPVAPLAQAPISATTVDQIEAAVQASLAALAEDSPARGPAEAELVLDEEMLREMVSDIVRRELQGSLGERITRNVRKLVRREIYRALETRDLG